MPVNRFVHCLDWQRPVLDDEGEVASLVAKILQDIRQQGDQKIDELSVQYDSFKPEVIPLKAFSDYQLEPKLKQAIEDAAARIERFCLFQKSQLTDQRFSDETGEYGFCYKPIERIGAYIPGGRFPLISTALMTLIPATLAGCQSRVACSPSAHPAILAAASLAGATQFIRLGGIQAIAALANGYQDIKPVDMIVGPGNQYVNQAKLLLQNKVSIDVAAGPSELLILADEDSNIEWLLADMLAQAEHDPDAISILVSRNEQWLEKVQRLAEKTNETKAIFTKQIVLLKADTSEQMIEFSDSYAPEHLLLSDNSIKPSDLNHYGSLFIGDNSAVAYGDYCSGPNHTLPTMGTARRSSGLSVLSFMKLQSLQSIHSQGRAILSTIGEQLAQAEQLNWHQHSMQIRNK